MDLPFLNAYLDAIGAPIFKKGCNFAAAASTILPATAASLSPFSFGIQVAQFLRFKDRVLQLQAKSRKFDKYIPSAESFGKGLYMFDIGQNDLAGAFYSKSLEQILASIPTILLEFETGIKKLYDEGARNLWIHNTGPHLCSCCYGQSLMFPTTLQLEVGTSSFTLHKFPLISWSGKIQKLLHEAKDAKICRLNVTGVPGGAEAFELAAKFCYGVNIDINLSNVAMLRCAAHFLEMTEDFSGIINMEGGKLE